MSDVRDFTFFKLGGTDLKKEREPVERVVGETKRTLEGVKVLEWAQFVAGPYCSKLLADLGAEVIKVEEPGLGDEARRRGPFPKDVPHPERSALFLYLNTNKKGITLSLEQESGREILRRLIAEVDVLVEDNPPRLVEELGLGYDNLKAINPRLVMTSITPFGQTGPYRDYKCYYLNTCHGSGFGYLNPSDPHNPSILEREPIMTGGFLAEYYSGLTAGIATMAAVYGAGATGGGQHIDVSKQEAVFQAAKVNVAQYFVDGEVPNRVPTTISASSWGGIMPCKDGYVYMMGAERHQVEAVFDLLGKPEWTKDERYSPEQFYLHGLEIRPWVQAWVKDRGKEEIWHGGQKRRGPISAIYTVGEIAESEHFKAREFLVEMDHPEAGRLRYPSRPYCFSATPVRLEHPAPLLGEHNEEIYCGHLGYSHEDLVLLKRTGII